MQKQVNIKGALRRLHYGPGDHPSGSPQDVHAGNGKISKGIDWQKRNVFFDFISCGENIKEGCPELDAIKSAIEIFEEQVGVRIEDMVVTDNMQAVASLIYTEMSEKYGSFAVVQAMKKKSAGALMMLLKNKETGDTAFLIDLEVMKMFEETINLGNQSRSFFFGVYHELGHYLQYKTDAQNFTLLDTMKLTNSEIGITYNRNGYLPGSWDDEFRSDFLAAWILADKDFNNMSFGARLKDYKPSEWDINLFQSELEKMQNRAEEIGLTERAVDDEIVHGVFELFDGMNEVIPLKKSEVSEGFETLEDAIAKELRATFNVRTSTDGIEGEKVADGAVERAIDKFMALLEKILQ